MDDFSEFAPIDRLQMFIPAFKFFECFQRGLGHPFVCFRRPSNQHEFLPLGDPFMTISAIQSHPDQRGDLGGLRR